MKQETDPVVVLRKLVTRYGSQRAAAQYLDVVPSVVSGLLKGRETFSDAMLGKLGLRRTVIAAK